MRNFIVILFLLVNSAVFAEENKSPHLYGDLYCPSGQHMIGLHQKCVTGGCAVDYLHCA